jgi:hypothetical protein
MWWAIGYAVVAYITAHIAMRTAGANGQRKLDADTRIANKQRICPRGNDLAYCRAVHPAGCNIPAVPHLAPRVYEREVTDYVAAVFVGLVWPVALFLASFQLTGKSRAERTAQAKLQQYEAERRRDAAQAEYDRLIVEQRSHGTPPA